MTASVGPKKPAKSFTTHSASGHTLNSFDFVACICNKRMADDFCAAYIFMDVIKKTYRMNTSIFMPMRCMMDELRTARADEPYMQMTQIRVFREHPNVMLCQKRVACCRRADVLTHVFTLMTTNDSQSTTCRRAVMLFYESPRSTATWIEC